MVKQKVTIPMIQKINCLYNDGYSMEKIAKKLNISHCTVAYYVWKPRHNGWKWDIEDFIKEG